MKLSLVCLFKKTVSGHIFRGKNRLVKPVSRAAMDKQILEYDRQEKIMRLLRYPYLTAEESSGHAKHLMKPQKMIANLNALKLAKTMKPHVTLEERLNHLKTGEAWD
ncbi:hypothetical protein Bhyg_14831 [Pseudolycoriella hygida]|uniref:Uncharacterized protein n=1 Tax=Pseudolycoriella hygida TaxID=35572 RepID=A0A9Q0MQP6_9DIPT|nr:hypothetical protein Bhyg_14831 [Pseudolycoriella hygida]